MYIFPQYFPYISLVFLNLWSQQKKKRGTSVTPPTVGGRACSQSTPPVRFVGPGTLWDGRVSSIITTSRARRVHGKAMYAPWKGFEGPITAPRGSHWGCQLALG